jgi:hypothetical protein
VIISGKLRYVGHVARGYETRNAPKILVEKPEGKSRDSSVGIALGYGMDDRGSRYDYRWGLGIFLFTTASRTALEPTQPPIRWMPGALSLGVKWPGREADHSPPSSAEVKELVELYLHSLNTPSWRGAQLNHRDNFNLTFNLKRRGHL